jgi:hypothetical protein
VAASLSEIAFVQARMTLCKEQEKQATCLRREDAE